MDNFIVSARKYRPSTFATVVGQEAITNTLKNAVRNQQVAQAFLFTGPRGVGKTTCARILAKTINCQNITPEGEACNNCPSCNSFNNGSSFNIFELDAASNNSVDDIRTLVDQVRIIPQQGYKVYIIDEVHMLSQAAFNAFLKTLEEPPAYAKFILATTEKHKILPTILSRCQIFDFRRISVDDIAQHLQFVASSEKIEAEPEALHIIAQKADGGLRDALSMFDQLVSYAGNQLTYKQVIENLNVLDYEYYFKITNNILTGDISNVLLLFNEIMDNGFEGQHFITGLGEHLRNLLISRDTTTLRLLETTQGVKDQYAAQSGICTIPFLYKALELLNECDINYKTSNNKKLHIEIALIQLCNLQSPGDTRKGTPLNDQGNHAPAPPANTPHAPAAKNPVTPPANNPVSRPVNTPPASPTNTPNNTSANATVKPSNTTEPQQDNSTPPVESHAATVTSTRAGVKHAEKASTKTTSLTGLDLSDIMTGQSPKVKTSEPAEEDLPAEAYGLEQITTSDVLRVWPQMVKKVASDLPLLENTLLSGNPELQKDNVINISINNNLQSEEVFKYSREITICLRQSLKNGTVSITTTIKEETPETRRPYTDKEKFIYLAERAPAVKTLKDQLGLDLEM